MPPTLPHASEKPLTIGALAKAASVGVETIRFYQRKGLLNLPAKPLGGIRHYRSGDVARLKFIKSAQNLGFSLEEITGLLRLSDGTHCAEASTMAEQKRQIVREKLRQLQQMESALSTLIQACIDRPEAARCPLITALQTSNVQAQSEATHAHLG
jgi:MerR family mercuric resistance operon transcriptional regulator